MQTILERYQTTFAKDRELSRAATQLFPDGVTHDSRYMAPFPVYISRAAGAKKWGVDGKEFIDYWAGHGALLLGHNPPAVVEAVTAQMHRGTHYGACHPLELEWARLVTELIPSAERIRFVSSGTEGDADGDASCAYLHGQEQGVKVHRAFSRLARQSHLGCISAV